MIKHAFVLPVSANTLPWIVLLTAVCVLPLIAVPASGAVTLTAGASPSVAHTGDTILLQGNISGSSTIAVFLFVTGPGLDPRGVALDNLNIPAGRGMFTTAPVRREDGSWQYTWDTSVILGTLAPGNYTVYVVDAPVDRLRFIKTGYTTMDITILPAEQPTPETPLDPLIPVFTLIIVAGAGLCRDVSRRR